jgi:hypothetical protein
MSTRSLSNLVISTGFTRTPSKLSSSPMLNASGRADSA